MVYIKDIEEELKIRLAVSGEEIVFVGFPAYISDDRGSIEWLRRKLNDEVKIGDSPLFSLAQKEIREYMRGERKSFDLPVRHLGTSFQRAVWNEIDKIEYGGTVSYTDSAIAIGREKSVRAVGIAVGANMLSILTPCHRVKGKNNPGGYAWGGDIKNILLGIEIPY